MGKKIAWTEQAKADLRAIDQTTALHILHILARYLATGEGDVKRLHDIEPPELRLRAGDYRPLSRPRRVDRGARGKAPPRSLPLTKGLCACPLELLHLPKRCRFSSGRGRDCDK